MHVSVALREREFVMIFNAVFSGAKHPRASGASNEGQTAGECQGILIIDCRPRLALNRGGRPLSVVT